MTDFTPDYNNILNAAYRIRTKRLPLYEHIIDISIMEKVLDEDFSGLYYGDDSERKQFFKKYIQFFKNMGYDTVSFECLITSILPESGALYFGKSGSIKNRKDFESYPWDDILVLFKDKYHNDFELLSEEMPQEMKAVGGPGNGIFECVQDVVGLQNLCMISTDDPDLYKDLFFRMGEVLHSIWKWFLKEFSSAFVICRFGDDLGFKSSTILKPEEIKKLVIPQYARIVNHIHSYNKPFLLHSCGNIFSIMDDLINVVRIDAKHSNEDIIAPFLKWQKIYGKQIALFGGADMSFLCSEKHETEIKKYIRDILKYSYKYPGFAFGTGNSVPDYMPVENYLAMIETVREFRGE